MQFLLAPSIQILSTLLKWGHSKRSPALGNLCRMAVLYALLRLPTAAAAHELEKDDVVTGYGMIPTGNILLMATVFVWSVHDNMRGPRRSLRDGMRGRLEDLSSVVWRITVLLVMAAVLAPAISDSNQLTAVEPIIGL